MKKHFNFKGILLMAGAFLYFYFLVGGIETFLNGNYDETLIWQQEHRPAFFFSIFIIYSLFILLMGLFNRFVVSFIATNLIVLFLATISYYKFSFLGEFLYPWDMLLYNNILNLLPNLYKEINIQQVLIIFIGIIAVISALIAYLFIKKPKSLIRLNRWVRLLFVGMAIGYLSIFIFNRSIPKVEVSLGLAGVTNMTFDQTRNYKTNGFMLTFLLNMQSAIVLPPKGYSEKSIDEIVNRLKKEDEPQITGDIKPNIVFIMSESFWDPTSFETAAYDPDPMPNVRQHQIGHILSSTFGGGTSNVEFEALTGFTNMFLPTGSVPYQQYIKSDLPSMPRYLADMGYITTAIHPYPKWFWNREEVYEHLGINNFIDIDGFKDPVYKGPFVSDSELTEKIIQQTEENDDPSFIYAISMQNHTGYDEDKYPDYDVKVDTPDSVEPVFNGMLRSYTQGVHDADAAFKELVDYYESADEPTIVVFFGDHLPAIGHDYKLFKQAGYVPAGPGEENWALGDFLKMRSTPLVIWNNYGAEIPDVGTLSPSFLGSAVFDLADINKPLYYTMLKNFKEVMPGYTSDIKIDAENNLFKVTPDEAENVKRDYELIQYDLLFGNQYSREELFKK